VTEDPKDPKLKLKLANVYEYDAKGVRFSKQANLAEAIAAFRKIEADLPKLKSVAALPEALLYDRQYSDVKKFYEDETNDAPLSYRLAALAVTDGVEAAQKAFDAAGVDASRQSQFTSAAQYLIFLHEYSAADDYSAPQCRMRMKAHAPRSPCFRRLGGARMPGSRKNRL